MVAISEDFENPKIEGVASTFPGVFSIAADGFEGAKGWSEPRIGGTAMEEKFRDERCMFV